MESFLTGCLFPSCDLFPLWFGHDGGWVNEWEKISRAVAGVEIFGMAMSDQRASEVRFEFMAEKWNWRCRREWMQIPRQWSETMSKTIKNEDVSICWKIELEGLHREVHYRITPVQWPELSASCQHLHKQGQLNTEQCQHLIIPSLTLILFLYLIASSWLQPVSLKKLSFSQHSFSRYADARIHQQQFWKPEYVSTDCHQSKGFFESSDERTIVIIVAMMLH